MVDETTILFESQPPSAYGAKSTHDTEAGSKNSHVDRMFLVVAVLGTQVGPFKIRFSTDTAAETESNITVRNLSCSGRRFPCPCHTR